MSERHPLSAYPLRVLTRSPYFLVLLVLTASSCGERQEAGLKRFQQATLSPCPLFADDIARWEGLPKCPFPAFEDIERPCEIKYFIEGDPKPRATRLLSFDNAGRLTAFSDSRGDQVVEARQIYYEHQGSTWLSHHYANHCQEPAPQFLYSLRETWDDDERPIALSSRHLQWLFSYRFEPHWLSDRSKIFVQNGADYRYTLELDPGGYVIAEHDEHGSSETQIDVRNGFIHSARWFAHPGKEIGRVAYDYQGHRLRELRFVYPSSPAQTYHFNYTCDKAPSCAPGLAQDKTVTPVTPTALSRDPELSHFVARDCSDQLTHSPHVCDQVFSGRQGLAARCCHSDEDGISFDIRNQFAGKAVVVLTLKLLDGRELATDFCRGEKYHSVCRIARSALKNLSEGMVTIEMTTETGQAIHVLAAKAEDLRRAAQ